MSEEEYIDDEYLHESILTDEDLLQIQEEYQKRRLIESLTGPIVSTVFHIALIIILAFLITDKYKQEATDIVVQVEEVEEVQIEEPPPIEEPVPEEVEETDVSDPVLTTVAIENVETNDTALEDVNDEAPSTDDDSTVEAVSDIVVSPSAFSSPTVFGGRSAGGRASAVSKFGGTKLGQENLLRALYWLKKVQNPNGSWGEKYHQAMTGLALLTFLAHGETTTSKEFGGTVRKAMEWLSNDDHSKLHGRGYAHSIKAYALAEAYAMTGVSMLEDAMNKTIRTVIDGIQAGGCYDYKYSKDEKRQDLSFAGWAYQAMKAAYGAGCEEPGLQDAIYKSVGWLKKIGAGSFPYATSNNTVKGVPGGGKKASMRAVGTLCLQLFGEGKWEGIMPHINTIATTDLADLHWEKSNLYAWYYATQAMFQHGGNEWKAWNKKFQKELNNNQHQEGYWEETVKHHGPDPASLTGRIYATTLCALQLTVYYRYLPSTKGAIGNKKTVKKKEPIIEEEGLNLIE